ncbi:MAG: efflux RND transporter permease subunit, partial [Bacteroidota bacterium]
MNPQPTPDKNKLREFPLSTFAVNNSTSVFLLTLMILLFGVIAYIQMPKEQFPEVSIPTVFVNTPYFGNSAADIESLITRPLEKELQSITGVTDIKSTSVQDYSVITIEFETDQEIEDVKRRAKDAVDKAMSELPNDLDFDPEVMDVNLSELPIVTVNISGDYTNDELREYAEFLQDELEEINEINEVELKGALEREVQVDVDLIKMESLQMGYGDIENAIASENVTLSGGEIVANGFRSAIRVKGEFETIRELRNLVVKSENQRPVYLRDVATVTMGYKDRTSIARSDRLPVISLDIIKRKGENLLNAIDNVKMVIEKERSRLPEDLKISLFNDQSITTRNEVNNLQNSIISGVILVVLVLLFFLGLRNASFVGIAIPLSMLMGILILSQTGVTLNIMVLFALILALGLLVDNGIVVIENIYRYVQEGYSKKDAAKYGAGEVAVPIIASTATTLAAFAPILFWPGIIGDFMYYLPFTLVIVLTSSLFVALVINPVFAATFMTVDEKADSREERKKRVRNALIIGLGSLLLAVVFHFVDVSSASSFMWARNRFFAVGAVTLLNFFILRPGAFYFQNKVLPLLERGYNTFIKGALRVPILIFVGTIALVFVSIIAVTIAAPKVILFPTAEPVYINAFVDLPLGTDIDVTDKSLRNIEERIEKVVQPYSGIVEAVLTQIGENTADPMAPPEPGASPQKARITVTFVPTEERGGISTFDIMNEIREAVKGFPGVQIVIDKNSDGPPVGKPINLEIRGEDIDQLLVTGNEVIKYFNESKVPGIEELKADMQIGKPELQINIDRETARTYGLSTYQIAGAIRTAVFGREVSKFKEGEEEYPIYVRLDEKYRYNVDNLLNQKLSFRNNMGRLLQIPISAVADVEFTSSYSSIKRKNLDRVVTINSNVVEGYNANEIVSELSDLMKDYELPEGFVYEFTGEQQQQAEDMNFLLSAFAIAVFAILIILVTQFNSISSPVIIILTVFFSTIGVFLGYAFTGRDISVIFTGVGIVSLAGIVVNNAIVLIDYINLLIQRKQESLGYESMMQLAKEDVKEAIIQGGATRLRPVLLTAITTVLGLIPLAVGFNFNFFTLISETDPKIFIGGDNTAFW